MLAWMLMAAQPVAPPDRVADDIRCLAVLTDALELAKLDIERVSISTSILYFVGRIDGAAPDTDIATAVTKARKKTLPQEEIDRVRMGCIGELVVRSDVFEALTPNAGVVREAR
ncbi:hypothetical protein ASG37_15035 [Sphingomonas sp. Leaf407]|nr:hypothetical protein ASE97_14290 [Sphingomonas sp. Leaf42]KQT26512.1 hypothetical protein ASG37_15035 [Sphingomonas sp. Leaf407]